MKKRTTLIVALVAISAFGILGGCARTIEARSERMAKRISGNLDFDPKQNAMLDEIRLDLIQQVRAQRPVSIQLKNDMIALVKSDAIDPIKLQELQDKMKAQHIEIRDAMNPKLIALHKTLTPAQKAKIVEKIEHMSQKMQEFIEAE